MATKHELELERARQLVADLEQKIAQEQTLLEGATRNMKELAISVHNAFCVAESHPGPNCQWRPGSEDDDADLADWTDAHHQTWLIIAKGGVQRMLDIGFLVTDPEETPAEPPPEEP